MRRIAFVYSGQGAQKPGMMKDLYNKPSVKRVFETADKILGREISNICFAGTQEELNLTYNTQPCVLAADIAAYAAFIESGIKPDAVAGFSLGEFAAVYSSGVMSLEDMFSLIQKRADAMQSAVPVGKGGMMAIVGADRDKADMVCRRADGLVEAVNFNCPGQIVLSGTSEGIQSAKAICKEMKIRAIPLQVSAPFHSSLMKPAAKVIRASLDAMVLNDALYPIYMNVDAQPTKTVSDIKTKLVKQTMSPVQWETTIKNMILDGVTVFIELGPGNTLKNFINRIDNTVSTFNVENSESLNYTISQLKGV